MVRLVTPSHGLAGPNDELKRLVAQADVPPLPCADLNVKSFSHERVPVIKKMHLQLIGTSGWQPTDRRIHS